MSRINLALPFVVLALLTATACKPRESDETTVKSSVDEQLDGMFLERIRSVPCVRAASPERSVGLASSGGNGATTGRFIVATEINAARACADQLSRNVPSLQVVSIGDELGSITVKRASGIPTPGGDTPAPQQGSDDAFSTQLRSVSCVRAASPERTVAPANLGNGPGTTGRYLVATEPNQAGTCAAALQARIPGLRIVQVLERLGSIVVAP